MNQFTEISVSLVNKASTLFLGTGFSKHLTDGIAPNWLELLVECTRRIDKKDQLINQLFNSDSSGEIISSKFDLIITAQILELEFLKKKEDLKEAVCEIIRSKVNDKTINSKKLKLLRDFFLKHPYINVITTNFDTLISDYIIPENSKVFIEDSSIPKISAGVNIYHIHGSVSKPSSLVLTLNDYFQFLTKQNYFSRKFFTLLQETSVIVMGYSLGDFNLNSILNEVRRTKKDSFVSSDIYYISRMEVDDIFKRFYSYTYGIHVIENYEIDDFVEVLEQNYNNAKDIIDNIVNLKNVLYKGHTYTDEYLKLSLAFKRILIQASSLGIDTNNKKFLDILITILKKKKELTRESGAWAQYAHLAEWLVTLGSLIDLNKSKIKKDFLELTLYSLENCSKKLYFGYSWEAYNMWNIHWQDLKLENQILIKDLIVDKFSSHDKYERRSIFSDS
jgi:hypothetical protein